MANFLTVFLNQVAQNIATTNLQTFLSTQGYQAGSFAVMINQQLVPRSQYAQTELTEGDKIDIILPMQGG
ncbi:MAG: sulfur carrier protein ThiS [Gammaproteobacteria bacterium]